MSSSASGNQKSRQKNPETTPKKAKNHAENNPKPNTKSHQNKTRNHAKKFITTTRKYRVPSTQQDSTNRRQSSTESRFLQTRGCLVVSPRGVENF